MALLGCAIASAQAARSQPPEPPKVSKAANPDQVLARARQLYSEQGPRQALPEFERALALYRNNGDQRGEAITLGLIGNCYKRFADYPKALDYLNRALTLKRQLGDRLEEGKTLSHLGLAYWEMGDYASAIDHLTQSVAIGRALGDHTLEGSALNNLGLVYDEQGDYDHSLEQYQRALALYEGTDFLRGKGDTLGNIGGVYMLMGQYHEAIRYYRQSLEISRHLHSATSESQDLGNLGVSYVGLGDIHEALRDFDRALQLARDAGLKKEEADWHKGKGSALAYEGQYTRAFQEYHRALDLYNKAGLKREWIEALDNEGALYIEMGDIAAGEKDFRQAMELSQSIGHRPGVTANLILLGELQWRQKHFEEADSLYRKALAGATQSKDRAATALIYFDQALNSRDSHRWVEAAAQSQQALQTALDLQVAPLEAQSRYACGEIARARGHLKEALEDYAAGEAATHAAMNPDLTWRLAFGHGQALEALGRDEEALAEYRNAVLIIEDVRSQIREERFHASFLEDKYQVYVTLVHLLLKLGRADDAFAYAERLRARSYLDILNRGSPTIANDDERATEAALRSRMLQLQRAIEQEMAKPPPEQRARALEVFARELTDAERDYQNLRDDLLRTEPTYGAARILKVSSRQEIQQALPVDTALVEYLVGEESLVVFVLTSKGLHATTVPTSGATLSAKVELLRDLLVQRRRNEWRPPAVSLYGSLISPIEQAGWLIGMKRLYLVPHEMLHYVPFAALPRGIAETSHLLVDDYVLAYLPSATSLVLADSRARATRTVFALAPARAHLLYAQQEAERVTEHFPPERLLLVGDHATEYSFKTQASRYRVIHLATHGHFDKLNPLFSGLDLEPDGHDDGHLQAYEILGLDLHADLVTLSACDTALGGGYFADVPAGDDLVGLTRAFLSAGSTSVLASLWEVNDRSTLDLMSAFYGGLRQDNKAEALANAQRTLRRPGSPYAHPYFWAAFALVGRMN
jgi:CHAT domain-containing protein/Tfp pilus assembly protein PilF